MDKQIFGSAILVIINAFSFYKPIPKYRDAKVPVGGNIGNIS